MRVVLLAVALESIGIVFDVYARGKKVFIHEADDALVRPHIGIQPSTATSHGRGAKIEEDGLILFPGFFKDVVDVVPELDFHWILAGVSVTSAKSARHVPAMGC